MSSETSGSETRSKATTTVQVEIFGSTYGVRSDRPPEHLESLAAIVDAKMREIAGQTVTVETSRIAILAALNLADELVGQREGTTDEGGSNVPGASTEEVRRLLDRFEEALASEADSG